MNFLTALGWLTLGAIGLIVLSAIVLVFILSIVAIKIAVEKEKDTTHIVVEAKEEDDED